MVRRLLAILFMLVAMGAAGWLALRRADIPYQTLEAAYMSPGSMFMTLDNGIKIHYRDEGQPEGEPLVLIHGFAASLHTWEPWVAALGDTYRIISIDLPAHGLSRAPDRTGEMGMALFVSTVAEVTEKLGVERFVLAGNSMGGHTAWRFALAYPDRLTGLMLVDAAGWPREGDEEGERPLIFQLLQSPVARAIIRDIDTTSLARAGLEDSFFNPALATEEMVERFVSLSRAPGHRGALLEVQARSRPRADVEALRRLALPTLILHGEADRVIPIRHSEGFARMIPNAVFIRYPNVGHVPQEEIAEISAGDARAFLETLNATDGDPITNAAALKAE